ncbi:MAG: Gfo/Idh/MocA family oxidoreductase [Planctomycetota bacterium]
MTHTTRRTFLQGLAAGSAVTLSPLARRGYAASPNDRIAMATIGLRNQGKVITRGALAAGADIVALADVDDAILQSYADEIASKKDRPRPDTVRDYREVIRRDDVDAVLIATPDHWHTKIAVEAMLAGKDVYCEKPLTLTIAEGKLIESVIAKTGRVFQVGTMQRSGRQFVQAIAMLRDGRIGDVKRVTCGINGFPSSPPLPEAEVPEGLDWDFWLGPTPEVPYRALPQLREGYGGGVPLYSNGHYSFRMWHAYSGGRMTDWGAHHVDIANWGLGTTDTGPSQITPVEFKMACEHKDGYPMHDDRYNSAMEFTVKVAMPGDVELIIKSGGDNGVLFEGSQGRFFVNRGKIVGAPVEKLEQNPLPDGAIEAVYGGPISKNHVANFMEAMRSRGTPISDVPSHNRMLEICHLSNIAMRLDRSIQWDAKKREIVGDTEASKFLSRPYREGYEIDMG